MPAYLICEDGPLKERIFTFDEGDNWTIGRDEDLCTFILEDPMVSRKHLTISYEDNEYYIENSSSTNPALLNDQEIEEKIKINEDDLVQIGNNTFRFTTLIDNNEKIDEPSESSPPIEEDNVLSFGKLSPNEPNQSKWMIKVISGPSSGGQFFLQGKNSYVIGSDTESCDIILHDLSISKNHARITLTDDQEAAIIDLNSKNGIFINGEKIENDRLLHAQDLITLGTTSLLFIDVENTRDTIYSTGMAGHINPEDPIFSDKKTPHEQEKAIKNWKDTFIPNKHLAIASIFSVFICVCIISILTLFRSTKIETTITDKTPEIKKMIGHFEDIKFNYSPDNATLFLTGHVLTDIDYNELMYQLKNMSYIKDIQDNVIIDESVYESINALLLKNPEWNSVLMTARTPGKFLLTGYIKNEDQKVQLTDYINQHFNYLNLLENQVVVEQTLNTQIQNQLIENGFINVSFEQNNGRLILSGRMHEKQQKELQSLISKINNIHGIRVVNNLVISTKESSSAIDISSKYTVTGSSKFGNNNQYVLINGKILGPKDMLDGMIITKIFSNEVILEKEGIKYKIDFNN